MIGRSTSTVSESRVASGPFSVREGPRDLAILGAFQLLVGSVPAGAVDVQTRCVNSAGEGLWSFTASVTIN